MGNTSHPISPRCPVTSAACHNCCKISVAPYPDSTLSVLESNQLKSISIDLFGAPGMFLVQLCVGTCEAAAVDLKPIMDSFVVSIEGSGSVAAKDLVA